MNRITTVELDGFKGQHRTFELGPRTVFSGPNELGKSAVLEAVRYAITGEVPSGKLLDAVREYFPERGGYVELRDEAGAWIRRGISIDHEKKKVSEECESSEGANWSASAALLDMRGFLALSSDKRREFVLNLVGVGETPTEQEIHTVLARDYARQIGGPGANPWILDGPFDGLPKEVAILARRWLVIWDVFTSYLTGDNTASEIFQKLTQESKDRKNLYRRQAVEAKSAARELEAAAKGAEAAAAELEKVRNEADAAADTFGSARAAAARREQALEAVDTEVGEVLELRVKIDICEGVELEDPGERPEVLVAPSEKAGHYRSERQKVVDKTGRVRDALMDFRAVERELKVGRAVVTVLEEDIVRLESEPIARAVALVERIRSAIDVCPFDDVDIDELLDLIDELAESWKTRRDFAVARLAVESNSANELETRRAELAKTTPSTDEYETLLRTADELELKAYEEEKHHAKKMTAQSMALEEWEAKSYRATEARTMVSSLKERYEATRARHAELAEKLATMPDPPVLALKEDVEATREALQVAEEAAGAVAAYRDAIDRAKRNKVAEASWKAAEAACKSARERYVADIVKPIVADIAGTLTAAGRKEQVYLRLENDRGKAIFDLGWTLGDSRRSLTVLSGGEAVLFMTALALALARRSDGRRILLIEADPLDDGKLEIFLMALASIDPDQIDACLVATSSDVPATDGWKCVQFGLGGSLEIDGYITCRVIEESELEDG